MTDEMMFVTITGVSRDDAVAKAKLEYGPDVRIIHQREREIGGLLGVGGRKVYEVDIMRPQTRLAVRPAALDSKPVKKENKDEQELLKTLIERLGKLEETNARALASNQRQYNQQKEEQIGELARIRTILIEENDFSAKFVDELLLDVKKSLYGNELDDGNAVEEEVLKELVRRMSFFKSVARNKPKVFILVGATGVGKTTTLVKIASVNLNNNPQIDIRLINMDSYKIAAEEQLKTYAGILNRPLINIYDLSSDLPNAVETCRDADLVLVDTSGSSPQEVVRLADLRETLKHFGGTAEAHLAISAITKESDIRDILSNFEMFHCKSVIITKMDETRRIGSVLAPLIEKRIPISYVTTGQSASSKEIEKAGPATVWHKLNGFSSYVIDKILRQLDDNNGS